MSAPEPVRACGTAAGLVSGMEEDVRQVGRWGDLIGVLACTDRSIEAESLMAVGRALSALGERLGPRWDDAFRELHGPSTSPAVETIAVAKPMPATSRPDAGDLLHGARAIATHLGIPKGVARHLIRARLIPWFSLGGVACARRSTLAVHFSDLEARTTGKALPGAGEPAAVV